MDRRTFIKSVAAAIVLAVSPLGLVDAKNKTTLLSNVYRGVTVEMLGIFEVSGADETVYKVIRYRLSKGNFLFTSNEFQMLYEIDCQLAELAPQMVQVEIESAISIFLDALDEEMKQL